MYLWAFLKALNLSMCLSVQAFLVCVILFLLSVGIRENPARNGQPYLGWDKMLLAKVCWVSCAPSHCIPQKKKKGNYLK